VVIKEGQPFALVQADGTIKKSKVKELYVLKEWAKEGYRSFGW
jgi:hypothetical protein